MIAASLPYVLVVFRDQPIPVLIEHRRIPVRNKKVRRKDRSELLDDACDTDVADLVRFLSPLTHDGVQGTITRG